MAGLIKLDPLYPVVDSADWVQQLTAMGIRFIQLRIKDRPLPDVRAEVDRALAACKAHGAQLVVNDYWQIALDAGADFIHLGQEDLDSADMAAIRAGGLRLGISTHSEAELQRALEQAPDYVALGPVYHTTLKVMPWKPQGLQRLRAWKERVQPLPLVAIGGITLERAEDCFAAGAGSVAMVSDITRHARPLEQAEAWLLLTRKYL